jgi:hypothetical protein
MRTYTHNFELVTMVNMFISALDDVIIKRFNRERQAKDRIKVRFVYAPKQRVLLDIIDKAQNIQLPVVAVSIGGINRDANRVWNKIQGSYIPDPNPLYSKRMFQPVPIDLTLNVSILTRYQMDFDQILTCIFAYTDPYLEISWRIGALPSQEIRSQVIWNGSLATQYPTDVNASQVARVQGDTSFTFKGWFFKAIPEPGEGKIHTINADFTTLQELTTKYSADQLDPLTTERVSMSAFPQPQITI